MSHRVGTAVALGAAMLLAAATQAGAISSPRAGLDSAQLSGRFAMTGAVTDAAGVRGERSGQRVHRTWTFAAACSQAPCPTISLLRERPNGTDGLTLRHSGFARYTGSAEFALPLTCGRHRYSPGMEVPYTITVVIEAARVTSLGPVASRIRASYVSRGRRNLTPCVLPPAHEAARYTGTSSSS